MNIPSLYKGVFLLITIHLSISGSAQEMTSKSLKDSTVINDVDSTIAYSLMLDSIEVSPSKSAFRLKGSTLFVNVEYDEILKAFDGIELTEDKMDDILEYLEKHNVDVLQGKSPDEGGSLTLEQALEQVRALVEHGEKPTDACKAVAKETGFRKGELYSAFCGE